jgi:prepilin-type N-terminal cleavage/methylation domain-containing protein/prepilin-type processing-associated H-X9-DG protein
MVGTKKKAFTLVELLVVISVIALLIAILMPALSAASLQARAVVCRSNLRQLVLANNGYATENDGFYVPAARDMWNNSGYERWHGVRESLDEPFDARRGPLVKYLTDGKVKECPGSVEFVKADDWDVSFEQGCGGYGYNMAYVGSRFSHRGLGFEESYSLTASAAEVARPSETLMFADSAMSADGRTLIEYSFVEPPFAVYDGRVITSFYMSPSVHFRHRESANAGWVDGHVDWRRMAKFDGPNVYGVDSADLKLGWFQPIDNTLFDLK